MQEMVAAVFAAVGHSLALQCESAMHASLALKVLRCASLAYIECDTACMFHALQGMGKDDARALAMHCAEPELMLAST